MGSLFSSSYDIDSYSLSAHIPLVGVFRFFILFATMIFIDVDVGYMPVIALICIYIATWSHFAAICAYTGLFTQKKWWPFIQVLLPCYGLMNIRGIFGSIVMRILNSKFLPILIIYIVLGIVFTIVIGLGELISKFAPGLPEIIFQWVVGAGILLALVISPFFFIGFVYRITRFTIRKMKDLQTWRRWPKTVRENSVTGTQLIDLFDNYYYIDYRIKTLRYIREKSLLNKNQESEDILLNIILIAETTKSSRRNGHLLTWPREFQPKNRPGDFEINLPDWGNKPWLKDLNPEFLDQAAVLVEKLRTQRQVTIQVVHS
jgi:hypothetical protein